MDETLPTKRRRISITEEDIYTLLQRYSATQLLALLREVSQSRELKIDWGGIAKKKSIGIENARECQMLWRHLAYGHLIFDKIESEAKPLDDDSDLETEVEASPSVSTDVLIDAANCVKALTAESPTESIIPNSSTMEVDIIANGQSSQVSSEHSHPSLLHGSNTNLPLSSAQKPTQYTGEGLDGNGAANSNFPFKRKRNPWTEEEDLVLINAVKKHGEGIWATIVKSEFNGNRTASQLSQRWGTLKRKQGGMNMVANAPKLSEQHLATRHALEHALKNPITSGSGTGGAGSGQSNIATVSNKDSPVTNDAVPSQHQVAQVSNTCSTSTPHHIPKKLPSITTDSLQATAVAVGARVSRLSDSQSLVRVAQAKNAVHIRGTSGSTSSLPPNVHFIRTGLSTTLPSVASTRATSNTAKESVVKPSVPIVSGTKLDRSNATPSQINEFHQTENEISGEVKVSNTTSSEKGRSTSPSAVDDLGQQINCSDSDHTTSKNSTKTEHGSEFSAKGADVPVSRDADEKKSVIL